MTSCLLGHAKLDTTARYAQVATNTHRPVVSPLDRLTLPKPRRRGRGRRTSPAPDRPGPWSVQLWRSRTSLRDHGAAWREANRGHVSLGQLKVMSAIERCRTAALGGHVARCENAACGYTTIAYNSCRNRHCPKCQGSAAREWMAAREAELLPVPYFHVVFTLPAAIGDIAYQNKAVIYDLLFKASAETMLDDRRRSEAPRRADRASPPCCTPGARAMTHHPHVHMIVPGGGHRAGRHAVDREAGPIPPARDGAVAAVPTADAGAARRRHTGRPARVLQRARARSPTKTRSRPSWRR